MTSDRSAIGAGTRRALALALGEPADRLARRDPALGEDPVHLHAPVLRDCEQEVENLGRLQVFRGIEQKTVDLRPAGFEVAL